jgi:rhodanese-related sulfurtransferase
MVRGVDDLVADARSRIERLAPDEAWQAASAGQALIVDIRSDDDRRRDGIVPGSLHIPRTVLEWRVDPASGSSNPHVGGRDRRRPHLLARRVVQPGGRHARGDGLRACR